MAGKSSKKTGDHRFGFVFGVLMGAAIGTPLAAWWSPLSGAERRAALWRSMTDTLRQPVTLAQRQVERLRGESISDALAEGRAIAARQTQQGHTPTT